MESQIKISFLLLGIILLFSFTSAVPSTVTDALQELNQTILTLQSENLPTAYVLSKSEEIQRVLIQIAYQEVLLNPAATEYERDEASKFLRIAGPNKSFDDVLLLVNQTFSYREQLFLLKDKLQVLTFTTASLPESPEKKLIEEKLLQARDRLQKEQLVELEALLGEIRNDLEQIKSQVSQESILKTTLLRFVLQYPFHITFSIIILFFLFLIVRKLILKNNRKKRIALLLRKKKAIEQLMEDSQYDRFQNQTLSKLVYEVRMREYRDQLLSISRELAILRRASIQNKKNSPRRKKSRKRRSRRPAR